MMNLKVIAAISAVICIAVFGLNLLVPTASAGSVGVSAPIELGQQSAGTATDCTKGCVLYTCSGGTCTVWYCSGESGCKVVGTFDRPIGSIGPEAVSPLPPSSSELSAPSLPVGHSFRDRIAYAKVCPSEDTCNLYALNGAHATVIGSFDNSDALIQATIKAYDAEQGPNGFVTPRVR